MAWINVGNNHLSFNQSLPNAEMVWNFCADTLGYSDVMIAGLLGNMFVESNVNPWIWQNLNPHPANGVGLNQWTPSQNLWNRLNALSLPANVNITNQSAGNDQLTVFQNEMANTNNGSSIFGQWLDQPGQGVSWTALQAATDVDEATRQWLLGYYRAGIPALANRQAFANLYFEIMGGHTTPGGGLQLAVLPVRNYSPGLTLTQGEDGQFSHQGTLAMDFAYSVNNVDYYAPVDMVCMFVDVPNATTVWNSQRPVMCVDGTISDICVMFVHDDNVNRFTIGDRRAKGEVIGTTGTAGNATGDHVHIEVSLTPLASGENPYVQNSQGVFELRQSTNNWRVFSICDNVSNVYIDIINGNRYPWVCRMYWNDGEDGGAGAHDMDLIVLDMVDACPWMGGQFRKR